VPYVRVLNPHSAMSASRARCWVEGGGTGDEDVVVIRPSQVARRADIPLAAEPPQPQVVAGAAHQDAVAKPPTNRRAAADDKSLSIVAGARS